VAQPDGTISTSRESACFRPPGGDVTIPVEFGLDVVEEG
jgi:hypothetical protein